MSNYYERPVPQLMAQLSSHLSIWRAAYDVTWKFPELEGRVAAAKTLMLQEELVIEDIVRTWVENQPLREVKNEG